jgi:uncharacterized membrane protein
VLYNLVKMLHILFIVTGLGANITYGFWQGLAGNDPERASFVLRGVKFLDDRVANPAYLLALATGLTMAYWHWSYTTHWIAAAIILYVVAVPFVAFMLYSPALARQIEVLEHDGIASPAYRRANIRATVLGIALFLPLLAILFLMVAKPKLG